LLAALGRDEGDDDEEMARLHTGAVLLAEALSELSAIRKILQQAFRKD
jgi:hypothetical protein